VATDLRIVVSAIHGAGDIGRMGDLALHVAQAAQRRHPQPVLPDEIKPYFAEMGRVGVALALRAGEVICNRDLAAVAESYALPMTCRVEVFVRSGHTIDLPLEDGEDRVFVNGLHEAWASPAPIGYKHLALGENAVILASEVVGYRLHGSILQDSAL
jgi:hypothetical protein